MTNSLRKDLGRVRAGVMAAVIAIVLTLPATALASPGDGGLTPAQIRQAYSLPATGARQTIGLVVAYHHPALSAELATFLDQFNLKPCSPRVGCLRTLNQRGQAGPLPGRDPTGGRWNTEAALSAETARAVCQSCSLLVVEADTDTKADLSAAAATAARAGARVVETSYTPPEEETDTRFAGDYQSPATAVVSATGDLGYAGTGTFPASLPGVIAVGGTQLTLNSRGAYGSETAWTSATSACSLYTPAPAWQAALAAAAVGCGGKRAIADVSAVADPGVLAYITDAGDSNGPWYQAAGTSVAAPIIAGMIGLAGSVGSHEAQMLYAHAKSDPAAFRDVKHGTTIGCDGVAVCSARSGYDGPTGLGSPYGLAAFLPSGGSVSRNRPAIALSAPRGLHADRRWRVGVSLKNGNPFAVRGSLRLQLSQRGRLITLATAPISLAPLGSQRASMTVSGSERSLVKRLRNPAVWAVITVRGPAGGSATSRQRVHLYAP